MWIDYRNANPDLFDNSYLTPLARTICTEGAVEPLTGIEIPAGAMDPSGNLREGLVFSYVNSRIRAVMLVIHNLISDNQIISPKIYASEAVTPFALKFRGIFSKFIGSEYATSADQKEHLFPILSQDLQDLSYPSNSFDIVSTNEVLEHVPSIDKALEEIYRVLKIGGWHIGTVPFCHGQDESVVRARMENEELVHLTEPEYHGNPMDEKGSLVFELPGWGILDRARAIGFSDAHMRYIISTQHACLSQDIGGILVLCLQK